MNDPGMERHRQKWLLRHTHRPRKALTNKQVVERLTKAMIRHTKNQVIGGEAALALPDADTTVEWLEMTDDERIM